MTAPDRHPRHYRRRVPPAGWCVRGGFPLVGGSPAHRSYPGHHRSTVRHPQVTQLHHRLHDFHAGIARRVDESSCADDPNSFRALLFTRSGGEMISRHSGGRGPAAQLLSGGDLTGSRRLPGSSSVFSVPVSHLLRSPQDAGKAAADAGLGGNKKGVAPAGTERFPRPTPAPSGWAVHGFTSLLPPLRASSHRRSRSAGYFRRHHADCDACDSLH